MKQKAYRHGELLFLKIGKLPTGLKKSISKVFMTDSGGNSHYYENGTFYPNKDGEFIFGYFKAKDTNLLHPEHGEIIREKNKVRKLKQAKLPDGNYELRVAQEYINGELKQLID